ncbi:hypothetical protein [Chromobacterium haemolyticum]|uniref:hypothetical protein n=1 Tax=Chromobacterium haemolyticum TaxID=394935 RepID=UPI0015941B8B|nr:hypothetical protein [Chromobacterium haemolyticum]
MYLRMYFFYIFMECTAAQTINIRTIALPIDEPDKTHQVIYQENNDLIKSSKIQYFEKQVQWVEHPITINDFLQLNGLATDSQTANSFLTLNPQLHKLKTIPTGSRLFYFTPTKSSNSPSPTIGEYTSVNMGDIARASFGPQINAAKQTQLKTLQLPISVYRPDVKPKEFQELSFTFYQHSIELAKHAHQMSNTDLILAQYLLARTQAKFSSIISDAKYKYISKEFIMEIKSFLDNVNNFIVSKNNDKPPITYHKVTVHVTTKSRKHKPPSLRVYTLPSDVFDHPSNYNQELIFDMLTALTFQDLTTPSTWNVPQSEMRLWIGPDFLYQATTQKVMSNKVKYYKPIHPSTNTPNTKPITFLYPDNVEMR